MNETKMKRLLEYESETNLPDAFTDLFVKYTSFISDICNEPDKLDCFMMSMRREMINWFSDHQLKNKCHIREDKICKKAK